MVTTARVYPPVFGSFSRCLNGETSTTGRRNGSGSRVRAGSVALLILVVVCSVSLLLQHYDQFSSKDTTSATSSLLRINSSDTNTQTGPLPANSQQRRVSRTVVGILVDFSRPGLRYRNLFRQLLLLHPSVCSLGDLKRQDGDMSQCELVYTFVIGARADGPTMQLQESFLVPSVNDVCDQHLDQTDCLQSDMTLLNIQENMNTGKSPTWLAYAAHISKELDIDYVAKQDTDTILFVDKFFEFAHTNLPPSPWAADIYAGWFTDKLIWPYKKEDLVTVKKFTFNSAFTLFAQGQWYLVSCDLAEKVGRAIVQHAKFSQKGYLEEHEDRDIASAILLATDQHLHAIFVSKEEMFWQHRVKIKIGRRFSQVWEQNIERMRGHIRDTLGDEVMKKMEARIELTNGMQ